MNNSVMDKELLNYYRGIEDGLRKALELIHSSSADAEEIIGDYIDSAHKIRTSNLWEQLEFEIKNKPTVTVMRK